MPFFSYYIKSLLLLIFLASPNDFIHSQGIYSFFNSIGNITDYVLTTGSVDEKYNRMFDEVGIQLGIENREIKLRNTGLIFRLFMGYENAASHPIANRVYVNEDCLKKMDDDAVRFLMAHELVHHKKHHIFKKAFFTVLLVYVKQHLELHKIPLECYVTEYFTTGVWVGIDTLSIWKLLEAQLSQYFEKEADMDALTLPDQTLSGAIKCMNSLYDPDMRNWPLYAKIIMYIKQLLLKVHSLPILKQHADHLVSKDDRISDLYNAYTV